MNRRDAIRRSRLRQKIETDVLDALRPEELGKIREYEKQNNVSLLATWIDACMDTVTSVDSAIGYVLQCAQRQLAMTEYKPRSVESLCEFCKRKLIGQTPCDCLLKSQYFPEEALEDEFALITIAQAAADAEEQAREKQERLAKQQVYADELAAMLREHEVQRMREAYQKKNENAETQRKMAQLREEQEHARRRAVEEKRKKLDELDQFCAIQKRHEAERKRKEHEEALKIEELQCQRDAEEAAKQQMRIKREKQLVEENRKSLQMQQAQKREQEEQVKAEEQRALQIADEEARIRAQAREMRLQELAAQQHRALNHGIKKTETVQEFRRKSMENAIGRWELERLQKEHFDDEIAKRERQYQIDSLNATRQYQIQFRNNLLNQERQEEKNVEQDMLDRFKREQEEDAERRRQQKMNAKQYGTVLRNQMTSETAAYNQRNRIGMTEEERRMNMPLLKSMNLLNPYEQQAEFQRKPYVPPLAIDHCTCPPKVMITQSARRYSLQYPSQPIRRAKGH